MSSSVAIAESAKRFAKSRRTVVFTLRREEAQELDSIDQIDVIDAIRKSVQRHNVLTAELEDYVVFTLRREDTPIWIPSTR